MGPPGRGVFLSQPGAHLIFNGVGGVLLLFALLVWPADIQVLHVGGQHLRDPDARQDAHHRSQHQHETHLRQQQNCWRRNPAEIQEKRELDAIPNPTPQIQP